MNGTPDELRPIALAIYWVQVITAVVGMMILPGLAGVWADRRWGTGFLTLTGFAIGLVVGIYYLLKATSQRSVQRAKRIVESAMTTGADEPDEADESKAGRDPDSQ
jgi:hypothetical protein